MKYMLMFCDQPHDADTDFDDGLVAKYVALQEEAEGNGTFVTGVASRALDGGSGARRHATGGVRRRWDSIVVVG